MNSIHLISFIIVLCSSVYGLPASVKSTKKFNYYPRDAWNAALANDTEPLDTPVPYVVIHHTYIPAACFSFEECSQSMQSMQRYHISLDWGDIGYNFCIGSEGGAYEGRGWRTRGIHTGRANPYSIGICLIGDWRVELPPAVQLATTKALIVDGVEKGFIKPDYKLIVHKQVMSTECPGEALFQEIRKWPHFASDGFNLKTDTKL